MIKSTRHRISTLRLVAPAPPPDVPPLAIGDHCRLNSGSPVLLVTDADDADLVVAWESEGSPIESSVPRACVRRVPA